MIAIPCKTTSLARPFWSQYGQTPSSWMFGAEADEHPAGYQARAVTRGPAGCAAKTYIAVFALLLMLSLSDASLGQEVV